MTCFLVAKLLTYMSHRDRLPLIPCASRKSKTISTSSYAIKSKNSSLRLHESVRNIALRFLGAGGQLRIAGILLPDDVGVLHSSSSEQEELFEFTLIGDSRSSGQSDRNSRSVDMFVTNWIENRLEIGMCKYVCMCVFICREEEACNGR